MTTVASDSGWERRARLRPWGIEIQIWRLVETQIYPDSAANLTLGSLLDLEASVALPGSQSVGEVAQSPGGEEGGRRD